MQIRSISGSRLVVYSIFVVVIGVSLTVLAYSTRGAGSHKRGRTEAATGAARGSFQTVATNASDQNPRNVDTLVPTGMPVSFAAATEADSEKGHEIKTIVSNHGSGVINSLAYATYEYDPTGNLVRVEGGIKRVDLKPGQQAALSIIPQRRSSPKNRLMIALEKATSDKESWTASHLDLASAGAEKANGKAPTPLAGKQDTEVIGEDFGSGFCINGYRRAMQLSEVGGNTLPTSFTCDQNERAYAFTFAGKSLVKK